MRTITCLLIAVLIGLSPVAADEKAKEKPAKPLTTEQAADAVLKAVKAKDEKALKALAERDKPDPWRVADALLTRGYADAAAAYAKVVKGTAVERLATYVAKQARTIEDPADGATLAQLRRARSPDERRAAVEAAQYIKGPAATVTRCRIAHGVARTLERLGDTKASLAAYRAAGEAAAGLGWIRHAGRMRALAGNVAFTAGDWRVARAEARIARKYLEAAGDQPGVAYTFLLTGNASLSEGDLDRAHTAYERARQLSEARGDAASAATALGNIGAVWEKRGDAKRSVEAFARAVALHEKAGDASGLVRNLANLALVQERAGDFKAARASYERLLRVQEVQKEHAGVSRAARGVGRCLERLEDDAGALRAYARALRAANAAREDEEVARGLHASGMIHKRRGDLLKARGLLERSVAAFERVGDSRLAAPALMNLAPVLGALGLHAEALDVGVRALRACEQSGDRAGASAALRIIGSQRLKLGDLAGAMADLERARAMAEMAGDRTGVAKTQARIAEVLLKGSGRETEALELIKSAVATLEVSGDERALGLLLRTLGIVQARRREYGAAIEATSRSLELARKRGERAMEAGALLNFGTLWLELGDSARALECYEQAGALYVALENKPGVVDVWQGIGLLHLRRGELDDALASLRRVLAAHESMGSQRGVASALINMGLVHLRRGTAEEGLRCFQDALGRLKGRWDAPRFRTAAHLNIALAYVHLGRLDDAARVSNEVLARVAELPDPESRTNARWILALVHLLRKEHAEAIEDARRAAESMAGHLGGLGDVEGARAQDMWSGPLKVGATAALRIGAVDDLTFFLETARAAGLRQALDARRALASALIPPELLKAETAARSKETAAATRYQRARAKPSLVARREASKDLRRAQAELAAVVQRIQRTAKAGAAIAYPEPAPLSRIQEALRRDEALVLVGPARDELAAVVVRPESAEVRALGKTRDMEALVAGLELEDTATDPARALAALRKKIASSLRLGADVRRLLIAPYGSLSYVPFSALFLDREIAFVPSGTTYTLLAAEQQQRGERVLAIGAPDYAAPRAPVAARALRWGRKLTPLPATREEARAVGDKVLLGKDATEASFVDAVGKRSRWRAVHLACHALVDAKRPLFCSLALTPDPRNDGFLTCAEVFRMQVPADLVVLSACDTGRGARYDAEGIVGLTRAFMFAGAPRVICSLWKVDDEATQALMIKFYELWNPKDGKTGLGAAAALKKAQEYVRDSKDKSGKQKWKHPYYWAAWVLWGLPE